MVLGEAFIYDEQEFPPQVGLDIAVPWRVVPGDAVPWRVVPGVATETTTETYVGLASNFCQANKGATASGGSVRFPVQTSQHNRMEKIKKKRGRTTSDAK